MLDFSEVIADCELIDTSCVGSPFTWEMKGLKERLDHMLFGEYWPSIFPITSMTHLPHVKSDHAPLLIQCRFFESAHRASFHFQHMWIRYHSF